MRATRCMLAGLVLLLGCSRSTAPKGGSASLYVSNDLSASFRVPAGWSEAKSWFGGKGAYAARFNSPEGDASVTAAQAPYAGINCAGAAKSALRSATGSSLDVDKEFDLKTNAETLSAGTGSTSSSGRQGFARYFCRSKMAVVVEAAADKSTFAKRQGELESTVDSLAFSSLGEQVAIRPPAAPATPEFFLHTVKFRGQTLGKIAEWYTGDYDNWKKLPRYNEDMSVPNEALKVGTQVKIPAEIVVRQDPLTEPRRRRAERRSSTSTAKAARKPSEAPEEPKRGEAKPSEEDEAEGSGIPPSAPEEEAAPLPPVIGPR